MLKLYTTLCLALGLVLTNIPAAVSYHECSRRFHDTLETGMQASGDASTTGYRYRRFYVSTASPQYFLTLGLLKEVVMKLIKLTKPKKKTSFPFLDFFFLLLRLRR